MYLYLHTDHSKGEVGASPQITVEKSARPHPFFVTRKEAAPTPAPFAQSADHSKIRALGFPPPLALPILPSPLSHTNYTKTQLAPQNTCKPAAHCKYLLLLAIAVYFKVLHFPRFPLSLPISGLAIGRQPLAPLSYGHQLIAQRFLVSTQSFRLQTLEQPAQPTPTLSIASSKH